MESSVLAAGVDRLVAGCRSGGAPTEPVRVLDLGGGTGGQALRLVQAGHDVTVVDPSLDALAALGRRAAELLLAEARADGPHEHCQVVFAPELVVRASTGAFGSSGRPPS